VEDMSPVAHPVGNTQAKIKRQNISFNNNLHLKASNQFTTAVP